MPRRETKGTPAIRRGTFRSAWLEGLFARDEGVKPVGKHHKVRGEERNGQQRERAVARLHGDEDRDEGGHETGHDHRTQPRAGQPDRLGSKERIEPSRPEITTPTTPMSPNRDNAATLSGGRIIVTSRAIGVPYMISTATVPAARKTTARPRCFWCVNESAAKIHVTIPGYSCLSQ